MASIAGGVKQIIVDWGGVGQQVWRDEAPRDVSFPYVIFHDYLGDAATLTGDQQDIARVRILQADLWFVDENAEDSAMVADLKAALNGAVVSTTTEGKAFRVKVNQVIRMFDRDTKQIRYVYDLRVAYLPA